MADTKADISIPANTWINLYATSSIPVGTECIVYNKGSSPFFVAVSASAPVTTNKYFGIPVFVYDTQTAALNIQAGASGLWVYSPDKASVALVQD